MGIMSGSRNRLRRNGSTASSESGPPNWNSTTPTLFFIFVGAQHCCALLAEVAPSRIPLFLLGARPLQPLHLRPQIAGPPGDAHEKHKEHAPPNQVRGKNAVQVLHRASASRCSISTSYFVSSSRYRSTIRKAASTCIASTL